MNPLELNFKLLAERLLPLLLKGRSLRIGGAEPRAREGKGPGKARPQASMKGGPPGGLPEAPEGSPKADPSPKGSPLHFQLPFPLPGEERRADLFLWRERGGGREGGEEALRLVFHLSPKSLGPLRVDALFLRGGLSIRFLSERREIARFIEGNLPQLERSLKDRGFKSLSLLVRTGSLLGEGAGERDPASHGLLDLQA